MLTTSEKAVLDVFREYLVTAGQMLCFHGQTLERYATALLRLTEKQLIQKEQFPGGYSLTKSGYAAMKREGPQRRTRASRSR